MGLPVFVLLGDAFLCEEKRREILSQLEKEAGPGLAVSLRHAGEIELPSLFSEARTLPFLNPAQVFLIREADQFTKSDLELWTAYFKSPFPKTFFIFEAESLEKNHPFLAWAGTARVFTLRGMSGRIVPDYIRKKLGQAGKKITRDAAELLESRVGDSLIFLDSILDQLILGSGQKSEIDRALVESLEERWEQFEGGDLVTALSERNLPRALEVVGELLEDNARDFPSLIGLLHWQLRNFWEAKKWIAEGKSEREVAAALRLWPSRAAVFFNQLKRFSLEQLEEILEGLFDLDWRLKTGRAEGRYEIENWLVRSTDASAGGAERS